MFEHTTVIEAPRQAVFDWHTRDGALQRLTPPWQGITIAAQADSLRDGRSVLLLHHAVPWVAQHRPDGYRDGASFADELVSLPLAPALAWRHDHHFRDLGPARTMVVDHVRSRVPRRILESIFEYRGRQLSDDFRAHNWASHLTGQSLTVAVTGATGLVGTALCALLTTGGHHVVRLVRGPATASGTRQWNPASPRRDLLDGIDVLVHLAGEPIAHRFTPEHEQTVYNSRVYPTRRLAELAARQNAQGHRVRMVCASAIGYYGPDRGDTVLTEDSEPGDGFLADVVSAWEAAADQPLADVGGAALIRTGIVQTPAGGTLRLLKPLFRAGLGGTLGDGSQWMSWIGLDDLLDVYLRAIVDESVRGPVNAVSPNPVRNTDYTAILAYLLHRPAILPVPTLGPRAILGTRGAHEVAYASQRVLPKRLVELGHPFRFARLEEALRHLLGRQRR